MHDSYPPAIIRTASPNLHIEPRRGSDRVKEPGALSLSPATSRVSPHQGPEHEATPPAPVAQWIEQAPSKRLAAGSSPAGGATSCQQERPGGDLPSRAFLVSGGSADGNEPVTPRPADPPACRGQPALGHVGVRVDVHGHVQRAVPDDVPDEVRRDTEAEQKSHAGVPEIVKADVQAEPLADRVEVPVEVPRLDGRTGPRGEDQSRVTPPLPRTGAFRVLPRTMPAQRVDADPRRRCAGSVPPRPAW